MKTMRRWRYLPTAGVGLVLAALAGCNTWLPEAGITVPSPHYLEHPPQYIPRSPAYPFTREEATMEATNAGGGPGGAAPLPQPVPGAP